MATQSSFEGNKTPPTVTLMYSSSEILEEGLTLMWRKGFRFGQSEKIFLFSVRNSDITVWFRCIAVELIVKDCNKEEEEQQQPSGIMIEKKKILKTKEVEQYSIRQERKEEKKKKQRIKLELKVWDSKGRQEGYDSWVSFIFCFCCLNFFTFCFESVTLSGSYKYGGYVDMGGHYVVHFGFLEVLTPPAYMTDFSPKLVF